MGEVYRARDPKLRRDVAIKVLPEAFSHDEERLARFEREARVLASVNHPNIATIHGLEAAGGVGFLVMECVEGTTLADRMSEGPLPVEETLLLFKQIAEALEAAHARSVVHRDLKPSNVKVTPEGHVKLLDFGLAKALAGDVPAHDLSESPTVSRPATRDGVLLGTAPYMSPEQARGRAVDHKADIWAFGCCLYEALSGKALFLEDTVSDTLAGILKVEPEWTGLPVATPAIIRSLLRRCLAKDPNHRLQHIGDARVEIEEALAEPSFPAPPESLAAATQSARRLLAMGAGGLAMGVALASVIVWTAFPSAESPMRDAVHFGVTLPADLELAGDYPCPVAVSPDGRTLAFVGTSGHEDKLYLRSLDSLDLRPIPGTDGARSPFFSPDSQWVGFFAGGELRKVSVDGGVSMALCSAQEGREASWAPDDTIVFTRSKAPTLYRVPASGGPAHEIAGLEAERGEMGFFSPHVLPGGRSVVFAASSGGGLESQKIVAASLSTGERRTLIEGGVRPLYAPSGHLLYSRGESLMAVRFDVEGVEVSGAPVLVLQGLEAREVTTYFTVSDGGVLAYVPVQEAAETSLAWSDFQGILEPVRLQPREYWGPSLSPDGTHVAMTTYGDQVMETWVLELDRGALSRFAFKGGNHIPVWTPDGSRLVFSSDREGPFNLFWKPADGSGAAERLSTSEWHQDPASWSPDGKTLAFAQNHRVTGWDIWLLHMDGETREEPFVATDFHEYHPMISPDGRWLAYASNESGRLDVYVQPFPQGGAKWLISTEGGTAPLWARDGRQLFYRDGDKLLAVRVGPAPTFSAGRPRVLFEAPMKVSSGFGTPDYDVTADGRRFLMIPRSTQPRKRIHVVLDWFEELRQLVPSD
jgi:serine/threonine-protein kinase